MRILAGRYKGKRLEAPSGRETRPTLGRVRQVLFDMLSHGDLLPDWAGLRAADIFAGSGSLGLEALSRGAAQVDFFETGRTARRVLAANIAELDVQHCCTIFSAAEQPPIVEKSRDVLLFDPPYPATDTLAAVVVAFARAGWLGSETLLVVQEPHGTAPLPRCVRLRHRRVGISALSFYRPDTDVVSGWVSRSAAAGG